MGLARKTCYPEASGCKGALRSVRTMTNKQLLFSNYCPSKHRLSFVISTGAQRDGLYQGTTFRVPGEPHWPMIPLSTFSA